MSSTPISSVTSLLGKISERQEFVSNLDCLVTYLIKKAPELLPAGHKIVVIPVVVGNDGRSMNAVGASIHYVFTDAEKSTVGVCGIIVLRSITLHFNRARHEKRVWAPHSVRFSQENQVEILNWTPHNAILSRIHPLETGRYAAVRTCPTQCKRNFY